MQRRQFMKLTAGAALLTLHPLLAQDPGGPHSDPGQILPGPFGYLGGAGKVDAPDPDDDDDDDEKGLAGEAADFAQDVGNWGMGAGGLGMAAGAGIFTFTGETGVGAGVGVFVFGGGLGMGVTGAAISGAGILLDAVSEDPPRPDYKRNPDCKAVRVQDIPTLAKVPAEMVPHLNTCFRAYASSANTLASLELHGGATLAKDAEWRRRHRANFVKYWNQMRSDLADAARAEEKVLSEYRKILKKHKVTPKVLTSGYQREQRKVQDYLRQTYDQFLTEWAQAGNTEIIYARQALSQFRMGSKPFAKAKQIRKMPAEIVALSNKLPVYK